jgi:hypothetical protein
MMKCRVSLLHFTWYRLNSRKFAAKVFVSGQKNSQEETLLCVRPVPVQQQMHTRKTFPYLLLTASLLSQEHTRLSHFDIPRQERVIY